MKGGTILGLMSSTGTSLTYSLVLAKIDGLWWQQEREAGERELDVQATQHFSFTVPTQMAGAECLCHGWFKLSEWLLQGRRKPSFFSLAPVQFVQFAFLRIFIFFAIVPHHQVGCDQEQKYKISWNFETMEENTFFSNVEGWKCWRNWNISNTCFFIQSMLIQNTLHRT